MRLFSRKYKFTDKKISRGGVLSSLFAVLATTSLAGFIVGIKSFKKDNIFLGFPWFGVVSNAIIWIIMFFVILVGI